MNDLLKNRVHRLLGRAGVRLSKARYYRFFTLAGNYSEIAADVAGDPSFSPVIFDVGANIGQTSLWYAKEFPAATIYAFEPVASTYDLLVRNSLRQGESIRCFRKALGEVEEQREIFLQSGEAHCQTNSLAHESSPSGLSDLVEVTTLDAFCTAQKIGRIDILKTDTEGFDMKVLRGATKALRARRIRNIVSEATILGDDRLHTQLSDLVPFLTGYGFSLHSLYDLHHDSRGKLLYFNAHFKLDE